MKELDKVRNTIKYHQDLLEPLYHQLNLLEAKKGLDDLNKIIGKCYKEICTDDDYKVYIKIIGICSESYRPKSIIVAWYKNSDDYYNISLSLSDNPIGVDSDSWKEVPLEEYMNYYNLIQSKLII